MEVAGNKDLPNVGTEIQEIQGSLSEDTEQGITEDKMPGGGKEPPALIVTCPSVVESVEDQPSPVIFDQEATEKPNLIEEKTSAVNKEVVDTVSSEVEAKLQGSSVENGAATDEDIINTSYKSDNETGLPDDMDEPKITSPASSVSEQTESNSESFIFVGTEGTTVNNGHHSEELENSDINSDSVTLDDSGLVEDKIDVDDNRSRNNTQPDSLDRDSEKISNIDNVSEDTLPTCEKVDTKDLTSTTVEDSTKSSNIKENPIEDKRSIELSENIDSTQPTQVTEDVTVDKMDKESPKPAEKEPTDEWLDILGNGLLQKKVLVAGKGRETRPVNGQEVVLRVKGQLADGSSVDCHDELKFMLGDEDAIVAMELAVSLMEDGEKSIVKTNSKYAYGAFGRPDFDPPIPQNADIEYEIEILSVKDGKDMASLTDEERIEIGDKKRMKGNYLYGLGDYDGAISMYTRGVKYLEGSSAKNVVGLCIKCWNNLSAAQLKIKAYKAGLTSCDTVLRAEPDNMKAYFRKGKCFEGLGDIEEALKCLKKASMLEPQNKMILQELGRLKSRVVKSQKKEREMYQRMMQGSGKSQDEDDDDSSGSWLPYLIGAAAVAAGSVVIGFLLSRPH